MYRGGSAQPPDADHPPPGCRSPPDADSPQDTDPLTSWLCDLWCMLGSQPPLWMTHRCKNITFSQRFAGGKKHCGTCRRYVKHEIKHDVMFYSVELRNIRLIKASPPKVLMWHSKNTVEQFVAKTRSSTLMDLNGKYITSIPHCCTICWFKVQINEPIVTVPYRVNEPEVRKLGLITNSFTSTSCCRT